HPPSWCPETGTHTFRQFRCLRPDCAEVMARRGSPYLEGRLCFLFSKRPLNSELWNLNPRMGLFAHGIGLATVSGTSRSRPARRAAQLGDRKSTRLNSSHVKISYAVFCLKKK